MEFVQAIVERIIWIEFEENRWTIATSRAEFSYDNSLGSKKYFEKISENTFINKCRL